MHVQTLLLIWAQNWVLRLISRLFFFASLCLNNCECTSWKLKCVQSNVLRLALNSCGTVGEIVTSACGGQAEKVILFVGQMSC